MGNIPKMFIESPPAVLSGSPGHTPYPHKRGVAPRRLFKRARSSEDAASSRSSDSSTSSLMLPPPAPPFNSPDEGCHAQMTSAERRERFFPVTVARDLLRAQINLL